MARPEDPFIRAGITRTPGSSLKAGADVGPSGRRRLPMATDGIWWFVAVKPAEAENDLTRAFALVIRWR